MLRGDIVKEDSGAYSIFDEQGSSASQMTAAEDMNVIARPPDCDGQAADAVSAYTQVKIGGCSQIVFHDIIGQTLGQTLKIQQSLLGEICTDTHLRETPMGESVWGSSFGTWMGKSTELVVIQGSFLSVSVDDF